MIVDNQQQFGVEIEPFFALYAKITQGDYAWIAANEQIPFPEKLYSLLQFYYILTFDAQRSLRLFENALALQIMPQKHQKELKLLKIIDLYLEANRFAEARTRVLETHEIISQMVVRLGMFRSQRKKYCSTRCPAI